MSNAKVQISNEIQNSKIFKILSFDIHLAFGF